MKQTEYQLICGMEVHAELKTKSKMFCGCKNDPFHASKPNCYTCPTCLGLPGALPVANSTAIEWTIKLGLALNCRINLFSKFDRKHYFYPDLPKGYQISQYDLPFCYDGYLETSAGKVRIHRIHLEEDTGKLLHKTVHNQKVSLVDFNRSGVPLIEIVTEPDIKSAAQAKEYAKTLRGILRELHISDCDMEQGGMRLEANISLQAVGTKELPNYKIELKNINSFRFLEQAINYEIERQSQALQNGEQLNQETRGWNTAQNKTFLQRTKEEAEDYRYFPDPDLPPIRLSTNQIEIIKQNLPELPLERAKRWMSNYHLQPEFATRLSEDTKHAQQLDSLFKLAVNKKFEPSKLANQIVNKKITVNYQNLEATLAEFESLNATATVDDNDLEKIIRQVLAEHQDAVNRYHAGQKQVLGFFMGQVMKNLKVKADPQQVRSTLHKYLDN